MPAFPAQWVDSLYVLSPVSGVDCHRCRTCHRAGRIDARVAAPGPHDFAVRCGVFACTVCTALTPQASIATRATLRDDRETSLMAARAESIYTGNQNSGKAKYFSEL